jgi:hypothetical protein
VIRFVQTNYFAPGVRTQKNNNKGHIFSDEESAESILNQRSAALGLSCRRFARLIPLASPHDRGFRG